MIKNRKDFVIGIVCLSLGTFIVFSDSVIRGKTMFTPPVLFARADTYIKLIGAVMALIAIALLLRSFGLIFKELKEVPVTKTSWAIVAGFISFFVFMLLLETLGFLIDGIWFVAVFSFIIRIKEYEINLRDRKAVLRSAVVSLLSSVVIVGVLYFVFTELMNVILP
jgi:hypothetical protein